MEALTEEALATSAGARDSQRGEGAVGDKGRELKDEWAERLGYEDESGVVIVRVARGSEAAKRGLRRGMLIQEINDEPQVETVEDYEDALEEIEPGSAFMMRVLGAARDAADRDADARKLSMRSQAIWHPAALAVYIRLEFHLSSAAAKGLLRCAASGPYEVYLNGERVGRGLGPAVAEVAMWEQFALDAALREGENVLLVFAIGCGTADWFRAEGKIERSDGAEQVLYTGAPWQVQPADAWGRSRLCSRAGTG